jgi:hypothetical protein
MSAGCRPGSVAEPEACGRTTRRRRGWPSAAPRSTACTGLTRARVSQLSSTSRRSRWCGSASAPTSSLRCCCSRCAGSSGSDLAPDRTPSGRLCLAHAGVFSAWFAPLFEEPALDRFRVMRPFRPGLRPQPGPIRAGQHRRSRPPVRRAAARPRRHAHPLGRALLRLLHGAPARPGRPRRGGQPDPLRAGEALGQAREAVAATYVGPALAAAAQGAALAAPHLHPVRSTPPTGRHCHADPVPVANGAPPGRRRPALAGQATGTSRVSRAPRSGR